METKRGKTRGRTPLYEDVASRISLLVEDGTFRPGERIPSIRDLSKQLRVSINTIKVAYGHLEDRRVIEARPQSGYYVCTRLPDIPDEPEIIKPQSNPCDISKGELVMKIMRDVMDPKKCSLVQRFQILILFLQKNSAECLVRKQGD